MISYSDFQKLELRAVKIVEAERVAGSEKLLRLQVDTGEEKCQIIAGIGRMYDPQDLIAKEVVIVANLEPKELMGLESQGMLLAADTPEGPVLLAPDREVPAGSKIK